MFASKTLFLYICFVLSFKSWIHCDGEKEQETEKKENSTIVKKQVEKLNYSRPSVADTALFSEPFHNLEEFEERWVYSQAKKDGVEDTISKYNGEWAVRLPLSNPLVGDNALILMSKAKHAAVFAPLKTPFKFDDKPLIVQYEIKFQRKHECGGAYIKLLADLPTLKLHEVTDKTEYVIMFGPDKCGPDNKIHFIFQHENPVSNKMEEKHAKKPTKDFSKMFEDEKTHLVTLNLNPDNSYKISLDRMELSSGNLLTDMEPPVNPEKIIDDPNDKRPSDWDEREKIQDLDAKKPEDWDEDEPETIADMKAIKPSDWQDDVQELIPDPAAVKPKDWDEEEDGEWEAPKINNPECKPQGCGKWEPPRIKNPDYKGKWTAPLIPNLAYKGIWKPKRIENPDYFLDANPFVAMKSIAAVGFELWSMQTHLMFDNLIISDDQSIVDQWTVQTWELKKAQEEAESESAAGLWETFKQSAEEKPWLWVVAAAAIFIPIVLIVWCCMGSDKTADEVGRRKKTDEPQPDDEVESDDEDEGQKTATEDESETIEKEVKKKEKESSDKEDEKPEGDEEKELVTKEEEPKKEKTTDIKNEEETNEATEQPSPRNRSSRRKARKDN